MVVRHTILPTHQTQWNDIDSTLLILFKHPYSLLIDTNYLQNIIIVNACFFAWLNLQRYPRLHCMVLTKTSSGKPNLYLNPQELEWTVIYIYDNAYYILLPIPFFCCLCLSDATLTLYVGSLVLQQVVVVVWPYSAVPALSRKCCSTGVVPRLKTMMYVLIIMQAPKLLYITKLLNIY